MALEIYTLSYAGGAKMTLEEWGVNACKVTTTSNGEDRLDLVFVKSLTANEPFEAFQKIELFDSNNVRQFVGYFIQSAQASNGEKQQRTFTFYSPWELIKRIAMLQVNMNGASPYSYGGGGPGTGMMTSVSGGVAYSSKILLNFDLIGGYSQNGNQYAYPAPLSVDQTITFALNAAKDFGVDFDFDVSALPKIFPPSSQHTDVSVADIVTVELRWIPAATLYWNFAVEPPQLVFTADLGAPITMTGLSELKGKPRYDLLIPRMEIFYEVKKVAFFPTLLMPGIYHDVDTSPLGFGSVSHFFELGEGGIEGDNVYQAEGMPFGIAAALHVPFVDLWHELEFSTARENVDWTYRVGQKFTIGGPGLFANANTVCQTITRDILSGTVSYKCGIPGHLGVYIHSFRGMSFMRNIKPRHQKVTRYDQASQGNSSSGSGKNSPTSDGKYTDFEVTICQDGNPVTKKFLTSAST